jgi:outer membrane protein TolC
MKRTIAIGLLIIGSARSSTAQEPLRLTIDEALRRGLDASHRLRAANARGDVARAVVDQRRAVGFPQIAAQAGYVRTNHVTAFGIGIPPLPVQIIYPDVPDN